MPGLKRMLIEPEDEGDERFLDADSAREPRSEAEAKAYGDGTAKVYDGRKRAPQFAHAETSCLWELVGDTMIIAIT